MGDAPPQHETRDILGTTVHENDNFSTTPVDVPSVAGKPISEFLIWNDDDNQPNDKLFVSMDGGTTYKTIPIGGHLVWTPKGRITQLKVKSNDASVAGEIILNLEP